ncbi:hypothetical protein NADFUDRAFT_66127 [Nadsonia fulvescens var. elongata DSM 6958]|uniref:Arrestin C-terminal-like domain-containing protein n=1 Tax=Nadsonia fulvescens var. elongata DSM 6958 TaxID=857566 RepID=A0A1E3PJI3_9ASCO|nr:hypothetical protein NADFUDRAFT_66127 [Nadsonia fulvescens var. elongata DSM 6958]
MVSSLTPPFSPPPYDKLNCKLDPNCQYDLKLSRAVVGTSLKKVSSGKLDKQVQVYLSTQETTVYLPQLSLAHVDDMLQSPSELSSQFLKGSVIIKAITPIKLKHISLKLQHNTFVSLPNETYKLEGSLLWDFQSNMARPDIYYDPASDQYHEYNNTFTTKSHIPIFDPYKNKNVFHTSTRSDNDCLLLPGEYMYNFIVSIPDIVPETTKSYQARSEYSLSLKLTKPRSFPSTFFSTLMRHVESINILRTPASIRYDTPENPIYIANHAVDTGIREWKEKLKYRINVSRPYISIGDCVDFNLTLYPQEKIKVSAVNIYWKQATKLYKQTNNSILSYFSEPYDGDLDIKLSQSIEHSGSEMPVKKVLLNYKSEQYNGTDSFLTTGSSLPVTLNLKADFIRKEVSKKDQAYMLGKTFFPSTFNPFNCIQVSNKIQFELLISFLDAEMPVNGQFRSFKLQVEIPVDIFSESCTSETVELPLYDHGLQDNHSLGQVGEGGLSEILPVYEEVNHYNKDHTLSQSDIGIYHPDLVPMLTHTSESSSSSSSSSSPSSSVSAASTISDMSSQMEPSNLVIAIPGAAAITNSLYHDETSEESGWYHQLGHRPSLKPLRMLSVNPQESIV